jgi:hypothetical protein
MDGLRMKNDDDVRFRSTDDEQDGTWTSPEIGTSVMW